MEGVGGGGWWRGLVEGQTIRERAPQMVHIGSPTEFQKVQLEHDHMVDI